MFRIKICKSSVPLAFHQKFEAAIREGRHGAGSPWRDQGDRFFCVGSVSLLWRNPSGRYGRVAAVPAESLLAWAAAQGVASSSATSKNASAKKKACALLQKRRSDADLWAMYSDAHQLQPRR